MISIKFLVVFLALKHCEHLKVQNESSDLNKIITFVETTKVTV